MIGPQARRRRSSATLAALLLYASIAGAHAFSPGILDVRQQAGDAYVVSWTAPRAVVDNPGPELRVTPLFPPHCQVEPLAGDAGGDTTLLLRCGAGGLDRIAMRNLAATRSDALIRLTWLDGEQYSAVVHAAAPALEVPLGRRSASAWVIAAHYVELGILHIAIGWDHLLFLLLLVLLTANRHRPGDGSLAGALIWTATAFTVAHSITLTLAALDVVRLPSAPVEAAIALSICFLAAALLPASGGNVHPQHAALGFGLLHGLGFAAALREAGLPATHLPLALMSFNVGVEIGQVVFVVACVALLSAAKHVGVPRQRLQFVAAYSAGIVAAAVTLERVSLFWRQS